MGIPLNHGDRLVDVVGLEHRVERGTRDRIVEQVIIEPVDDQLRLVDGVEEQVELATVDAPSRLTIDATTLPSEPAAISQRHLDKLSEAVWAARRRSASAQTQFAELRSLDEEGVDLLQLDEPRFHLRLDFALEHGLEALAVATQGVTAPIIVVSGADYATCKETVRVAEKLNLDIWECIPKPVDLVMLRHFLERLKDSWNTVPAAA